MIGFLIGIFIGGVIGVTVMALMNAAARSDEQMNSRPDTSVQ